VSLYRRRRRRRRRRRHCHRRRCSVMTSVPDFNWL